MKLTLLDRDGVVIVNRSTNVKTAADIALLDGAPDAIRQLNDAGFTVAICTNQPEVARGIMTRTQLDMVHAALTEILREQGAVVDRIFSCVRTRKCPDRKPSCGMLREAIAFYGARAEETPFVGDQTDDLKAAFHARCRRFLVKTGLGAKALEARLPSYVAPVIVCSNLPEAAARIAAGARNLP
jgi:D-glycero-D-manno-heptose 1,7-bisphosphate phosphatase